MSEHISEEERLQALAHQESPTSPPGGELDDLFRRYHGRVLRAAYRVTGNAMDAEDVLQTVFFRLARREAPPVLEPNPGSYLHRAAVNAALDVVRARGVRPTVPLGDELEQVPGAATGDPDRQLERKQFEDHLRRAIAKLQPRAAEMFILRHFEGLPLAEIARTFDTSTGVVAVTLFRTRGKLKTELKAVTGENR